eukprot:5254496-Prymnesium_polylepis.1
MAAQSVDELLPDHFGRSHWRIALILSLCYGVGSIAGGLPIYLLPRLRSWSLSSFESSLVSSAFFGGNLAGLLFWGSVCDRRGRLFGVRCGLALLIFSACATFLSGSLATLLAARALTGFSNGAYMNASFVLLAEVTAPNHRMLAKAVQECGFAG